MRNLKAKFLLLTSIVLLGQVFLLSFVAQPAQATSGETYSWVNSTTITASGGQLKDTATFTSNNGWSTTVNEYISPTDKNVGYCDLVIYLRDLTASTFTPPGSSTPVTAPASPQVVLSSPSKADSNYCGSVTNGNNVLKLYSTSGQNITLANTQNSTKQGAETSSQQQVIVQSRPTESGFATKDDLANNSSNVPQQDTLKISAKGSSTALFTSTPSVQISESNIGTQSYIYYQATFSGVTPGNYTVCSQIADNCTDFTKTSGVSIVSPIVINGKNQAIVFTPAASTGQGSDTTCEGTAGPLGWLVCGVINFADDTVKTVGDVIGSLLEVKYLNGAAPSADARASIYTAWQGFRNIADALLIVVFLLIIFGQTLGIEAYTVKKALPRIVAAAILIQVSFIVSAFVIDVFNIFGNGISGLFSVVTGHGYHITGTVAITGIGGAIAAGVAVFSAVMSGAALLMAVAALIAVMGVFLTLAFRDLAIIVLIISAPLAFLAWVLPNTEKFFKMWWTNFLKILFMYPLMMLIFAVSNLAYNINTSPGVGGAGITAIANNIIDVFLIIAPLFAIPFVFKAGGQLMSFGAGVIAGRTGAISSKVQGAQWQKDRAKDRLIDRQRKGAEAAENAESSIPGFGAIKKARGRINAAGVGGLLKTKRGQRLMDQRYSAGTKAAAEDFQTAIDRSGLTQDELVGGTRDIKDVNGNVIGKEYVSGGLDQIAEAGIGQTVRLGSRQVRVDAATQSRAIQILAQRGSTETLDHIRTKLDVDNPNNVSARSIWQQGIQSSIPDLIQKAPDLIKGAGGAFGSFSPEQLAAFNKDTIDRMNKHINALPTGTAERLNAETNLVNALRGITNNPTIAARVGPETASLIRAGAVNLQPSNRSYVESIITDRGAIMMSPPTNTPPTTPTPPTGPRGTPPVGSAPPTVG